MRVALLVVLLLTAAFAGVGIGAAARSSVLNNQSTITVTSTITSPTTQQGTTTTMTVTQTSTSTVTASGGETTTITATATRTASMTTFTETITSLRAGMYLVQYNGTGYANSAPFTATTSTVAIKLNVSITSSDPSLGSVAWYIVSTNGTTLSIAQGSTNGKSGSFSDFGYNFVAGQNYYVKVLSANADWSIIVAEMK